MSVLEYTDRETELLKEKLHRQIDELHDFERLSKIEGLLDFESCDIVYTHTPEEEAIIDEAIRDLDAGFGIPLNEALRRIEEQRSRKCV